jgi:hypothetical protein
MNHMEWRVLSLGWWLIRVIAVVLFGGSAATEFLFAIRGVSPVVGEVVGGGIMSLLCCLFLALAWGKPIRGDFESSNGAGLDKPLW